MVDGAGATSSGSVASLSPAPVVGSTAGVDGLTAGVDGLAAGGGSSSTLTPPSPAPSTGPGSTLVPVEVLGFDAPLAGVVAALVGTLVALFPSLAPAGP